MDSEDKDFQRRIRSRRRLIPVDGPANPYTRLLLLRILVPLGGHRKVVDHTHFRNLELAEAVGLKSVLDGEQPYCQTQVLKELRKLHEAAEKEHIVPEPDDLLGTNLVRLREVINLTDAQSRIFGFGIHIHTERLLDDTADSLGPLSGIKLFRALAVLLDIPEPEVREALGATGMLARSGLLSVVGAASTLKHKLELMSSSLPDRLISVPLDLEALLRGIVNPSAPATLALEDYPHIVRDLDILRSHLARSCHVSRAGVNVLIHGSPGTGKTQLAKVLAQDLGCELLEVACEDDDGDPISGESRLMALRAAQCFFKQRPALLLFDEVEDVFRNSDERGDTRGVAQRRKAWLNRMLEENPVPVIWVSNSICSIDSAFIRRFDMVLELPVPPRGHRSRILRSQCDGLLDPDQLDRLSRLENLAPAVVAKTAAVIRNVQQDVGATVAAEAFERLVHSTLTAQGYRLQRHSFNHALPDVYDPAFINADVDLAAVAEQLSREKSGRLCLYGPPGTGKTAYARWLAEKMDAPMLVKRGSDLLSAYVGENEKNIARAFSEAERDGAILVIDEIDSFLQDRRNSRRTWETTLVNEMLTQMESFPGVFIASTNLMDGLDEASLRRFDLKVKFDYLRCGQAVQLLCRYCRTLHLAAPEGAEIFRLDRIPTLTPGDFANVARQSRLRPLRSCLEFITALESECRLKRAGVTAPVGFVH